MLAEIGGYPLVLALAVHPATAPVKKSATRRPLYAVPSSTALVPPGRTSMFQQEVLPPPVLGVPLSGFGFCVPPGTRTRLSRFRLSVGPLHPSMVWAPKR